MGESEKSIRLVTALVECRPDGEYAPWGIKWYDGTVYPFDRIESHSSRSWGSAGTGSPSPGAWSSGTAPAVTSAITKTAGMSFTTQTMTPRRQAHRKNSHKALSNLNVQVNGLLQSQIRPQKVLPGYLAWGARFLVALNWALRGFVWVSRPVKVPA